MEVAPRVSGTWKDAEGTWVVEIVCRGCLCAVPLGSWAKSHEFISDEEAQASIEHYSGISDSESVIPSQYLADMKRKRGPGRPVFRIRLPVPAIWALFEQGEGPLNNKFQRQSAQVLVRAFDDGFKIWSHRAFALVEGARIAITDKM